MNRQHNPSINDRRISLSYNWSRSLSSSVKNSRAKHIHIPKIKNQNKSYFALSRNALNHIACRHTANSNKTIVVVMNDNMNCITNFDGVFFINNFHVILSEFSLFFIVFIHHFRLAKTYRSNIITNSAKINSFHIRNRVQNLPSRHNHYFRTDHTPTPSKT